jgi:WD40 repeat protein
MELIGFTDNEHFLAHCTLKNNSRVFQVRDVKSGQITRNAPLPTSYVRTAANAEFSPDGKYYAMTAKGKGASLVLYELAHNSQPRSFAISSLNDNGAVDPAGIAFSRDDSRVSAMFSREGEAYVVTWTTRDAHQVSEQIIPCGPGAKGVAGAGRVFDWLGDNAWLINGNSVVEAITGKPLATLSDVPIKGQWVAKGDICQLQYFEKSHGQLAALELDPTALGSAPAATAR